MPHKVAARRPAAEGIASTPLHFLFACPACAGKTLSAKQRRSHFASSANRQGACFSMYHVWTFQMYDHVMNYATITLNVPFVRVDLVRVGPYVTANHAHLVSPTTLSVMSEVQRIALSGVQHLTCLRPAASWLMLVNNMGRHGPRTFELSMGMLSYACSVAWSSTEWLHTSAWRASLQRLLSRTTWNFCKTSTPPMIVQTKL